MDGLTFLTIVDYHVKAASKGDQELMQSTMSMASSCCSARNVVKVVNALYSESNMIVLLDER